MNTPTALAPALLTSTSTSSDLSSTLVWLFWIASAVAVSPLIARATRGLVPDVVSLLVLGCLIGPGVLDLASTGPGIDLLSDLGLGLLFLIAGTEIEPAALRSAQGRHAAGTWLLCMLLGFAVGVGLRPGGRLLGGARPGTGGQLHRAGGAHAHAA